MEAVKFPLDGRGEVLVRADCARPHRPRVVIHDRRRGADSVEWTEGWRRWGSPVPMPFVHNGNQAPV
jgi:hypothetical protein